MMSERSKRNSLSSGMNLLTLRTVAKMVLPLYSKVASNRAYAKKLTRAIRTNGDVEAVIREAIPIQGIETAKIGYFMCYGYPGPELCNGMILRSERAKFTSSRFCAVAKAVIPFYEKLIRNRQYALRVLRALRAGQRCRVKRLVRSAISTPSFHSVTANKDELRLYFCFRNGVKYENSFFS